MLTALIVEDDASSAEALADWLKEQAFESVECADSLEVAGTLVDSRTFDLVLLDLDLPDGRGLQLLEPLKDHPDTSVVVVTGHGTMTSAVDALRGGVVDFLTKPIDLSMLGTIVAHVRRAAALRAEVSSLRTELRELGRFKSMVGASKPMQAMYSLISKVAPTSSTVLVVGETGVGKELVAQTLHELSPRADRPLVAINCGAVPKDLIESSLFGHEKGSFTGAVGRHQGYFEQAAGGTLFLDEVTEMPADLQIRLLRVLETHQITRVGGNATIDVDVRVVAATNRDPQQAVADGKLREDLYYRLNVFPIHVPALRDRGDDIRLIAEHFLGRLNRKNDTNKQLTRDSASRLLAHRWPGNVRELRNVVERAYIVASGDVDADCIPIEGGPRSSAAPSSGGGAAGSVSLPVGSTIKEVERQLILATLEQQDGNKQRAADCLGISLKTLYNRLNTYEGSS